MIDERSVIPEFMEQLSTLGGKRERERDRVMGKYKIQDTKRFVTASAGVMKLNPNYSTNIPLVDAWRESTKRGKYKLRDQDVATLINYGEKVGYYKLFHGATRQYCFSRVALACVWTEFVKHFDDIVKNALKKNINPNNIVRPEIIVLDESPLPNEIDETMLSEKDVATSNNDSEDSNYLELFEEFEMDSIIWSTEEAHVP